MKKFLLKCDALKSDKEVLEHAFELFGPGPRKKDSKAGMVCGSWKAHSHISSIDSSVSDRAWGS